MLHDVGMFIGRNGHHKHSYYLIKNAGLLGHSEEELELIATIARYHRGSEPKDSHPGYNALPSVDRKLVTDMAAILRIAEALDRSHRQVVEMIKVNPSVAPSNRHVWQDMELELCIRADENIAPESWAFKEKKGLFEQQFQTRLTLKVEQTAAAHLGAKTTI